MQLDYRCHVAYESLKNLAEKFGWEEFVTLSTCSLEIKTRDGLFHARLESMNPSAILLVACAVAASVVGLVLFFYNRVHANHPGTTAVMGRL